MKGKDFLLHTGSFLQGNTERYLSENSSLILPAELFHLEPGPGSETSMKGLPHCPARGGKNFLPCGFFKRFSLGRQARGRAFFF